MALHNTAATFAKRTSKCGADEKKGALSCPGLKTWYRIQGSAENDATSCQAAKRSETESAKTLEVDRTLKNLSEYKASLIAAKASRKRKRDAEVDARFVKNIQPISVGV